MTVQRGDLLLRVGVPDSGLGVFAGSRDRLAIGTEGNGKDVGPVTFDATRLRLLRDVPQNDQLIAAGRRQRLAIRTEGYGVDGLRVSLECCNFLYGARVP